MPEEAGVTAVGWFMHDDRAGGSVMLRLSHSQRAPIPLGPIDRDPALRKALREGLRATRMALDSAEDRIAHGRPAFLEAELVEPSALAAADIVAVAVAFVPAADRDGPAADAIARTLRRLDRAIARHCADAPPFWASPAWAEDVVQLERTVGPLPHELVSLLARHDGSDSVPVARWELLSAARIESSWQCCADLELADVEDAQPTFGVKPGWWNARWIPFAGDGAGNTLCIDLDPAPGGCVGQVIEFVHDHEMRPRLADSLSDWLAGQADLLDRGDLVVIEHADSTFDMILERAALKDASFGLLRVRGESPLERTARIERDTLSQPIIVELHFLNCVRRMNPRLRALCDPLLWIGLEEVFAVPDAPRAIVHRAVAWLRDRPGLEALEVDGDTHADELELLLR